MCVFLPLVGFEPRCGNLDCCYIEGYYILCILCVFECVHMYVQNIQNCQFTHIDVYNFLYAGEKAEARHDFPLENDASPLLYSDLLHQ
jgi:hypothetical protein